MALVLNEEQTMLRDSAHAFVSENAPVAQLRKLRDSHSATGFSPELWTGFAEMGFTGILVPEQYGGLGLGHVEAGIVMEEIGHTLAAVPFFSTSILAASALVGAGSADQKARYLPDIASGALIATLAIDEGAKHRPARITCSARRDGNHWRLDGSKAYVVDGHVASLLVVAARTDGDADDAAGVTLFLVDGNAPGVTRERIVTVDAHNAAHVRLSNVAVGEDAVLGTVGAGPHPLGAVLDAGRSALAFELLGAADEAFMRTTQYLKERTQFGKTIGEFQALQHRAATLFCDLELTRAAVLKAAQSLDAGSADASKIVSIAKARAGTTATLAVQEGVQMHGGIGMTDDIDLGFFMKRVRVAQELLGDAHFHADRFAQLCCY